MKILVTGGAGFIGSHVVDAYIAAGHSVVVVDDLSTGTKENLNPKAIFYKADICDVKALAEIFHNEVPEVVNHHAAQVSVTVSEKDPIRTEAVNYQGTLNLLKQPGIKRFIFSSTGGALFSDPAKLPAGEETPTNPISKYGASKLSAEAAVKEYAEKLNFSYVILRYANVFGPRQYAFGEGGVVAIFCELAKGNKPPTIYGKDTTRDYVYVADVATANALALTAREGTYHIATGVETTNQQVYETIRDTFGWNATPIYSQLRPGEIPRSVLSSAKAQKELGWKPTVTFKEGVQKIHAYGR